MDYLSKHEVPSSLKTIADIIGIAENDDNLNSIHEVISNLVPVGVGFSTKRSVGGGPMISSVSVAVNKMITVRFFDDFNTIFRKWFYITGFNVEKLPLDSKLDSDRLSVSLG